MPVAASAAFVMVVEPGGMRLEIGQLVQGGRVGPHQSVEMEFVTQGKTVVTVTRIVVALVVWV